ncbi:PARP catalytic domain-containing protein [Mycena sanguinolenta]|uniref:PARP catalytic domain-containing protein n=1 Tax=Mycena sanguinolenta TaxID=230812 RepID=A0A8H6YAD6_9AGAR|nr:PARP catalytic domain-containing protein [Mycena sanguinolenta]
MSLPEADDYFIGVPESPFRAVLVNRVVVGNPLIRQYNAEEITELPDGYHSVVGVPGVDLNYEETVVHNNDAIRPAYLIVYGPDVDSSDVGSLDVDVDSSDVDVDNSDVDVDSLDVDVDSSDVDVNGSDVAVDGSDVAVDSSDVAVDSSDVDSSSDADTSANHDFCCILL